MARKRKYLHPLLFALIVASCTPAPKSEESGDQEAVQSRIQSYAEAYRNKDAQSLAEHWTENGEYISPQTGYRIKGRSSIREAFEQMFAAAPDSDLEITVSSIDFDDGGNTVEKGTATVTFPGALPSKSAYTAIHVKKDGKWYLESVSEKDFAEQTEPPEQLKELGWMIGNWVEESGSIKIVTDCNWDLEGHFLKCLFTISVHGYKQLSGVHYIGWDPIAKQIHSWVFDSAGGYAEGSWERSGNRWSVHLTSTLPSGQQASSICVYTLIDANTYKFVSSGREVGGVVLPNTSEVSVKRQKGAGIRKRQ